MLIVRILCRCLPFLITGTLTYVILKVCLSRQWMRRITDIPNERSSHTVPTPSIGGLIFVPVIGCMIQILWFKYTYPRSISYIWYLFMAESALIMLLGVLDHLYSISPLKRLCVQCGVAYSLIYLMLQYFLYYGPLYQWVYSIVGVIWIVGMLNAYNFMDGINGISGLQGIIGMVYGCMIAHNFHNFFLAEVYLIVAGGVAGFLILNWSPSKVFMGDAGSTFLGMWFAVLPLLNCIFNDTLSVGRMLVLGILPVWMFIFDAGTTFLKRLIKGERVLQAHKQHLFQRLNATNVSHARIAQLYGIFSLIGCFMVLGLDIEFSIYNVVSRAIFLLLIGFSFNGYVVYREEIQAALIASRS